MEKLTKREKMIFELLVNTSMSNKQLARMLKLSIHTIKAHTHKIYEKLGVFGRIELIKKYQQI